MCAVPPTRAFIDVPGLLLGLEARFRPAGKVENLWIPTLDAPPEVMIRPSHVVNRAISRVVRKLCGVWVALVAFLALGLAPGPAGAATQARERDPELARLLEDIRAILEREGVPGAGIALVDEDGLLFAGGVGWADLATRRPVDASTLFRVGSITKSIVALGVARLDERGVLDLDAPLETLVPGVEIGNPHPEHPITLAHALEHTAGFDDMRFNETFGPRDVESRPLVEVLARNPRSRVARWVPGSRFAYSNPGYTVAAAALEQATGRPFEEVLRDEVLAPLGMNGARFRWDPALADRLAVGHDASGTPLPYHALWHRPAGSLMVSPPQLARLVELLLARGELPLGRGRLVAPETVARIERCATLPFPNTDVSYGLGNYGDVLHPVVGRGHDGGLPGFLSTYRYFPELGVGYVLLLNATHSPRAWVEIRQLLFDHLTRGRRLPRPPTVDVPDAELAQYVGHYEFRSPRHAIAELVDTLLLAADIELHQGQLRLHVRAVDGPIPLIPTGPARFRFPGQAGTAVQFAKDHDGRPILVVQNLYFERTDPLLPRLRERALRLSLLLLESAWLAGLVLALVHLWSRARQGAGRGGDLRLLAPFLLGSGCLVGAVLLLLGSDYTDLGTMNLRTVGICVLPLSFAALSAFGLVRAGALLLTPRYRARSIRPWVRVHAVLVGLAAVGLALYLAHHHLVGLRTWAW